MTAVPQTRASANPVRDAAPLINVTLRARAFIDKSFFLVVFPGLSVILRSFFDHYAYFVGPGYAVD